MPRVGLVALSDIQVQCSATVSPNLSAREASSSSNGAPLDLADPDCGLVGELVVSDQRYDTLGGASVVDASGGFGSMRFPKNGVVLVCFRLV